MPELVLDKGSAVGEGLEGGLLHAVLGTPIDHGLVVGPEQHSLARVPQHVHILDLGGVQVLEVLILGLLLLIPLRPHMQLEHPAHRPNFVRTIQGSILA